VSRFTGVIQTFIFVFYYSKTYIDNSVFTQLVATRYASAVKAGLKFNSIYISNSTFINNACINGGVFDIKHTSYLECYNCTIIDNFGVLGGVITVVTNSRYNFSHSVIENNLAFSVPVADQFDAVHDSIVQNCKISNNKLMSKEEILAEISPESAG
jgi:hypothetical protein